MVSSNLACSSLPVGSSEFIPLVKKMPKWTLHPHGIITQYLIYFSLVAFMCYVTDGLTVCRHPNPPVQSKDKTNQKVSTFFKLLSIKMIGSQRWNAAIRNRTESLQSFIEQHTNVLSNMECYHYQKCWKICYRRQRRTGTEDREHTEYIHNGGGDNETQV